MGENVAFHVIFDTCDVVYHWLISLLPHNVLDNLFGQDKNDLFILSFLSKS